MRQIIGDEDPAVLVTADAGGTGVDNGLTMTSGLGGVHSSGSRERCDDYREGHDERDLAERHPKHTVLR
jgi:hypothetical protein